MTALKASSPESMEFLSVLTFGDGIERVEVEVECEARSVSVTRHFTREHLKAWGLYGNETFSDRVVLTVSELVTNAVLHARTRQQGESELISLSLVLCPDTALGVLVTDNSPKPPREMGIQATATNGRGLHLVSTHADCWTAAPRPGDERGAVQGKGVWAFFRCPCATEFRQSA